MPRLPPAAAIAALLCAGSPARALPVEMTAEVAGQPGDWTITLNVSNRFSDYNLFMFVYLFGVQAPQSAAITAPPFSTTLISTWENSTFGGSSLEYNNIWADLNFVGLFPGVTSSGLGLHLTTTDLPATLPWFAYGYGLNSFVTAGEETGCFHCGQNPGFEGTITLLAATDVPEPASAALSLIGLFALAAIRRRR